VIRAIIAIIFLLFLPGFCLVQALFPRKNELSEEEDWLYRIVLSVVLSIVISIFLSFVLSQLGTDSSTGKGYFTTINIIISLSAISVVLFIIGVMRGAYPPLYTRKEERLNIISKEQGKDLKAKMKRYRELKLHTEQLKKNLENDLSYKARRRFKQQLEDSEREMEQLSKDLKIDA
jgi:uncharacterized membrane protein